MAAAPDHFSQPRRTALIVDDSRLACAVLGRLLEQEGFHVEMAAPGQEALDCSRKERPDVVFMDHLMPGMTGLDAVRALKADPATADIPVVAGTAADAKMVPLTEVLTSTGITGPVELRSRSGSYCLELVGAGDRLTPMPQGAGDCFTGEHVPLLAGMTPAAAVPPGP